MATVNRLTVGDRSTQSATAVAALLTSRMKPKTKAKIKQDKYWKKINGNAITQFPKLLNNKERLEDQKTNAFKGILIKNQAIDNSPCRKFRPSHKKRLVDPSRPRFSALNRTRTDPLLTRSDSREKSIVHKVTVDTISSSRTRKSSRPNSGATRSAVSQPKTRAALRAAALATAITLSQCRDCSVVLTRIDTTLGVKCVAPNVIPTIPSGSAACATAPATRATSRLIRNPSVVAPLLVSLTKSGADKVTSSTASATVGCPNASPMVTQPRTRAAVRATALTTTEIIIGKCRDCRVILRRIDTTEFKHAAPNITATDSLSSTSLEKLVLPDVNNSTQTRNSNRRVTRAKGSAAHSNSSLVIQPKSRATFRATDIAF